MAGSGERGMKLGDVYYGVADPWIPAISEESSACERRLQCRFSCLFRVQPRVENCESEREKSHRDSGLLTKYNI
jgi:hypothetical protein